MSEFIIYWGSFWYSPNVLIDPLLSLSLCLFYSSLSLSLSLSLSCGQVFGGLLEQEGEEEEDEEATDQGAEEKEDEPTSMVNILFNKSSLSGLQKQVQLFKS